MKRGILLFFVFITLIGIVLAQGNELSVTFYSFGKNATINLKNYFGEGHSYFVTQTQNVIVRIDQEKGIATLTARPGWKGSEIIRFFSNETVKVEETEEVENVSSSTPETFYSQEVEDEYLKRTEEERLTVMFKGTIDPSILDFVRTIEREEITNVFKEIKGKTVTININDEVTLNLEQGYEPKVSMNFTFDTKEDTKESEIKETGLKLIPSGNTVIITLFIIAILVIYLYMKYASVKPVKGKGKKRSMSEDIKHLSLDKLRRIQNEPYQKESAQDFMNVIREFFSKYFGIEYDFEFKQLIKKVEDSNLSGDKKDDIKIFLDDASKVVYYSTEKWTQVPIKDFKNLMTRMKRIIQDL